MSIRVMSRAWDHSAHCGSELLMLLAIADFADDEGHAYPAVPTLATKCRMSARNANMLLAKLRESGELEIRIGAGPRGTNMYRIRLTAPLKPASSLASEAHFTPEAAFTLKPASPTPEAGFPIPLKPASDESSLNRHEPEEGRAKRSPTASRGSRLSQDWSLPDEWRTFALKERPDLDPVKTAERFKDFWIAKAGKEAVKLEWFATWRNWVRSERPPAGASSKDKPAVLAADDVFTGQS